MYILIFFYILVFSILNKYLFNKIKRDTIQLMKNNNFLKKLSQKK